MRVSYEKITIAAGRVRRLREELQAAQADLSALQKTFDEQNERLRNAAPSGTAWAAAS